MAGQSSYTMARTEESPAAMLPVTGLGIRRFLPPRRVTVLATFRAARAAVVAYYGARSTRFRAITLSLLLSYGGGAVMFWFHAIYRGEQGPPIANIWHWILDSSLGFLALTPVLVLLLPLAEAVSRSKGPRQAVLVGGLFAAVTTPGPILHDHVAGAGTPLARVVTRLLGADPHVVAAHLHVVEHSGASEALLQLAVGLPVYIALSVAMAAAWRRLDERKTVGRTLAIPPTTEIDTALVSAA